MKNDDPDIKYDEDEVDYAVQSVLGARTILRRFLCADKPDLTEEFKNNDNRETDREKPFTITWRNIWD